MIFYTPIISSVLSKVNAVYGIFVLFDTKLALHILISAAAYVIMALGDIMEQRFIITGISSVIMVGKEKHPDKITSFSANLKSNELIFQFSGDINVKFGNNYFNTTEGSVRFLPEGDFKVYEVEKKERPECIDVFFKTDLPISSEAFVINVTSAEYVGNLFKKLFATWISRNDGYYFECISILYKIFAELQKSTYVPETQFSKIRPAIDLIHKDFLKRDITSAELASICSISESYFKRIFKEKYVLPPKKYIIQLKINHACELLRLERYSVTQIAEMSGFSDVYFFSRQFKEYIGITPTQFIKKYRTSK
mgnify:CR=1 FL=1